MPAADQTAGRQKREKYSMHSLLKVAALPGWLTSVRCVLLLVVAMLYSGCSGDSGSNRPTATVPAPTEAVATQSPVATRTPPPPDRPFEGFSLEMAPDDLVFEPFGSATMPADRPGYYFLDVASSRVEGWIDAIGGLQALAFSGDNRLTLFERREQVYVNGVVHPAGQLLADRATGRTYQWSNGARVVRAEQSFNAGGIASTGGRVLFRVAMDSADDWFAVVDIDQGNRVLATFRAEGALGLLSDDASYAVVAGDFVQIVDLSGGRVEQVDDLRDQRVDLEGSISLRRTPDNGGFLLTAGTSKSNYDAVWRRYDWSGRLLAEGADTGELFPSPDGRLLALARPVDTPSQSEQRGPAWYAMYAIDTSDGRPLFRVIGISTFGGYTSGNRWLADGSGLVLSDPSFRPWLAMRDGRFLLYVGMPSPDNPNRFAAGSPVDGGPAVRDLAGRLIASAMPVGRSRSFVSPWGLDGSEMRFFTPHLGHGGTGYTQTLVQPVTEVPPYNGPPRLLLRDEAISAPIYDAPAGQKAGILTTPRVLVNDTRALRREPSAEGYAEYCSLLNRLTSQSATVPCLGPLWGTWARVTTISSVEGWMLLQVSPEGE